MISQHAENGKTLAEGTVAVTAIAAPLWMQTATTYIGFLMALGGLVLLALTIAYRYQQWRNAKEHHDDE